MSVSPQTSNLRPQRTRLPQAGHTCFQVANALHVLFVLFVHRTSWCLVNTFNTQKALRPSRRRVSIVSVVLYNDNVRLFLFGLFVVEDVGK